MTTRLSGLVPRAGAGLERFYSGTFKLKEFRRPDDAMSDDPFKNLRQSL